MDSLAVSGCGKLIKGLIRELADGLKWLHVSFHHPAREQRGDPRPLLRDLDKLKGIHIDRLYLDPRYGSRVLSHLETLSIEIWQGMELWPLIKSYPNKSGLHLRCELAKDEYDLQESLRSVNLQSPLHWCNLSHYWGDVTSLYALAPQCRISYLDTWLCDNAQYFCPILHVARPSRMRLTIRDSHEIPDLLRAVPFPIKLPLTRLSIRMNIPISSQYTLEAKPHSRFYYCIH